MMPKGTRTARGPKKANDLPEWCLLKRYGLSKVRKWMSWDNE